MKSLIGVAFFAAIVLVTGCATPQGALPLNAGALEAPQTRIGIAMSEIPKPDTFFPGAGCLLCYATASLANKSLTNYTQTLSSNDLGKIKYDIEKALAKKGLQTKIIDPPFVFSALPDAKQSGTNIAKKDFSSYLKTHGVDKLLVIQLGLVGYSRTYASYVPTAEPKAFVNALGYIVDLNSNVYDWYWPVEITRASEGPWDEPDKFPGLTNAYYQALTAASDELLKPFALPSQALPASPSASTSSSPAAPVAR